ncbi:MAG: CDP-glycerol glycerophosphotransferase family protein, partial [Mogibacterium sp.]|nr:CDP-glycerol glycerophosphotransferase family protein [Mogibacterium sp.]
MARKYSSKRSTKSIIIKNLKKPIKSTLSNFSKNNAYFRKIYLKLKRKRRSIIFNNAANQPIEEKTILFESFVGRKYADSPKAIYEYMVNSEEYKDYKFIWFFRERCLDEYIFLEKNERTSLMLWGSPEYYKCYATAKYWITNSRMPLAIVPREEQVYVQCWHGTPLKRLGFDVEVEAKDARNKAKEVMDIYESDARRYKYMVSPSSFCTEKFKSAFNLEAIGKGDIIIEEGYPRNDEIVNHTPEMVEEIKKNLGIAQDKKVALYAPTWRESQYVRGIGYTYQAPMDFEQMRVKLGDEYVILYRTHYFIDNAFDDGDYQGFVYDVCEYPDINDLYIISDVLITDYSSVFFD